ncbi:MAG: histidine kinase [Eubacteriales bacterium]|nr:histidine kinase [Eubacteriales bacterium]
MGRGKNRRNLFSLKKQISRFLLLGILLLLLLFGILLAVLVGSYQKNQNEQRLSDLESYAETLDNSIVQLNGVVGSIYSTNSAFEGIDQYRVVTEEVDYTFTLRNLLKIQVQANKNLSGLFLYYDNLEKELYYVSEKMSYEVKEILKQGGRTFGQALSSQIYTHERYVLEAGEEIFYNVFLKKTAASISGCVSLSLGLPDTLEHKAAYGVLCDGVFYQTAGAQTTLDSEICKILVSGKNRIPGAVVYLRELGTTDLAVVEILPMSLWLYVNWMHLALAALGVAFVLLSVRIYRLVTRELIRPLEDMTSALRQIQEGVWEVNFQAPNRVEEIENVRQTVNVMLKEIEQYKIRTYEEQLEKQKTQLQYLQLQLAPHFYTNCLKNAYYMLMLKEYDNVEQFLLCLSTHLRYLLQKDTTMVTVGTERDFVQNYLQLQRQMTTKALLCEMQIDEEALEEEIPILALQTFVENAVKYARGQETAELRIRIQVRLRKTAEGDYLDISIRDNGPGYPEEVLHMLNQEEPSEEQSLGVGILNLQSRIRLSYGADASWYFENSGGACSELILPVGRGKEDERPVGG